MYVQRTFAAMAAFLFVISASAQAPSVPTGGILNNASYIVDGLPGAGIARGSMFAVFGSNLGPASAVVATELPLTAELGGAAVEVAVGGVTRQAYLLVASAGQLAAVMPSDVPAGDGTLTVIVDGVRSQPTPFKVVDSAFGIFSRNQAGFGPGIVQNFVSEMELPTNSIFVSAEPGGPGILWGTGLGPITGSDADLPPVGDLPVDVEVWVGGRSATILYAGRSPQFPGIDQVNFMVPADVTGCYVPVRVVVDGMVSNDVTIAVAEQGGPCADSQTFLPGELEAMVAAGGGSFGHVELARFRGALNTPLGPMPAAVDQLMGTFRTFTLNQLATMRPRRDGIAPIGSCLVTRLRAEGGFDPVGGTSLSAGPQLTLSGPNGEKAIPADGDFYEQQIGGGFGDEAQPEFIDPGEYVLRGGADSPGSIGSFEVSLNVPQAPQWLNQASFTSVPRDQDLTVEWTGGDPANEIVVIAVQSLNRDDVVFGSAFCTAAVEAGSFTIPSSVLGALPAGTPWTGEGDPTGLLMVGLESRSSLGSIEAEGLSAGRFYYALRQVQGVLVE